MCCLCLSRCSCHSQVIAFWGGWEISAVQAVQPGRCESQAATPSHCCASHTWNRVKTAATYSAPASELHSQHERAKNKAWVLLIFVPQVQVRVEGGVKLNTERVKTPQRNPIERQAGKLSLYQVACPGVSLSVNSKHCVTLQERKVLNIFRDRYLTIIQRAFRETVKFLSCS